MYAKKNSEFQGFRTASPTRFHSSTSRGCVVNRTPIGFSDAVLAQIEPAPEDAPDLGGGISPTALLRKLRDAGYGDEIHAVRLAEAVRMEARLGKATLKSLRLRAGLSQADLAGRIGTRQSYIARLENEPAPNPELATMLALCEALGVDLNTLGLALR